MDVKNKSTGKVQLQKTYNIRIEIEVIDDYTIEEIKSRLNDQSRVSKIAQTHGMWFSRINLTFLINKNIKTWSFVVSINTRHLFDPLITQDLILDVFDNRFKQLTIQRPAGPLMLVQTIKPYTPEILTA
jgi:hypothetical protein